MEGANTYKTETFTMHAQEYLYEIKIDNQNSLIKIYNSHNKLRSTQRISLPANCTVLPCENYLVLISPQEIHLLKIGTTTQLLTAKNPGIKNITSLRFNSNENLLFFISDYQSLYYIMPETEKLTIKLIFESSKNGINGRITELAIDREIAIYILVQESQTMFRLTFDWNRHDNMIEKIPTESIVGVYCRFQWTAIIKDCGENYKIEVTDGEDNYVQCVPKINDQKPPIIKGTTEDFLYLDGYSKILMLINKKEQVFWDQSKETFPKSSSNRLLFEVVKQNFNTINLKLHYYESFPETFKTIEVPIEWLQLEKKEEDLMYIHSNIHLIFDDKGVCPHFYNRIKNYLKESEEFIEDEIEENERERSEMVGDEPSENAHIYNKKFNRQVSHSSHMNNNGQELATSLLSKLFQESPITTNKLAQNLVTKNKYSYLATELSRYPSYILFILTNEFEELTRILLEGSEEGQTYHESLQLVPIKNKLKNMVNFAGVLEFAVRTQEMFLFIEENGMEGQQNASAKFNECLQKCKIAYIAAEIVAEHFHRLNNGERNEIDREIMSERGEKETTLKLGANTCHECFDNRFKNSNELHIKEIFQYLKTANNFYEAAYFFLYLFPLKKTIPYISDSQTVELISFLSECKISEILQAREKQRLILKKLLGLTSKALIVNDPNFLQFICSISINCNEIKSCLAILLSGSSRSWQRSTHEFILKCYVLCDRVLLAYNELDYLSGTPERRQYYLEILATMCIESRRVKDLLRINSSREDEIYLKERVTSVFGNDIEEIISLMKELNERK